MRPSQVEATLNVAIDARVPVLIWGGFGIGKSDVVRQVASERPGWGIKDVRVSQLDSVDLRGIPSVVDGVTKFNPPEFLPHNPASHGVLFLDELTSGSQATMAACYQLILDRSLGEYKLPDGWAIVAASNRLQDRGLTNVMPAPLRNRFMHIDMEVHLEDWCMWALDNNVHAEVLSFIRYRPEMLNEFDQSDPDKAKAAAARLRDARAFATPRSWNFLSKLLTIGLDKSVEFDVLSAVVGEGPASEFMSFLTHARTMPNLDAILVAPDKMEVPEEPATRYAVATGLAMKASVNNFDRVMTYLDRMPPEFAMLCVKDSIARTNALCETAAFSNWAQRNGNVIL